MARKRSRENPPPSLPSEEKDPSEENDDVEGREEDEESPARKAVLVRKHHSSSDSDNTIPNVSDFQIKTVINSNSDTPTNKPTGSKRPAPSAASASTKNKKKKKDRAVEEEAPPTPTIVLGLPRQQTVSGKKSASKNKAKCRPRSEVIVNRQGLHKSVELDEGKEIMDGKSKKFLEKMLEMYIKRNELVQEQTRLLLEELKSEKKKTT